ncbi:hypothetical protein L4N02_31210, partial [Klebsiella variicola]|uniref:hypothetical protein n=5 Tax=Klebsiella TaxID=570 RepID=UPI001F411C6D
NVVWHNTPITAVRRMLSKNSAVRLFLHFCQSNKSILVAHYLLLSLFKREGLTTPKKEMLRQAWKTWPVFIWRMKKACPDG